VELKIISARGLIIREIVVTYVERLKPRARYQSMYKDSDKV